MLIGWPVIVLVSPTSYAYKNNNIIIYYLPKKKQFTGRKIEFKKSLKWNYVQPVPKDMV